MLPFVKNERKAPVNFSLGGSLSLYPSLFWLFYLLLFLSLCQKLGPLSVPLVAAFFGSGRQQVACDEKFSAEPDLGDKAECGSG